MDICIKNKFIRTILTDEVFVSDVGPGADDADSTDTLYHGDGLCDEWRKSVPVV